MNLLEYILQEDFCDRLVINDQCGNQFHADKGRKRPLRPVIPANTGYQYWRERRKARLETELSEIEDQLWVKRVRLPLSASKRYRMLNDLKRFRRDIWIDDPKKKYTVARLSIPKQPVYYGVSAHGQKMNLRPNAISRSHAEGDVFNQASRHRRTSHQGHLVVDRPFCKACGEKGGVLSMARQIGLRVLDVVQPGLPYLERIYLK